MNLEKSKLSISDQNLMRLLVEVLEKNSQVLDNIGGAGGGSRTHTAIRPPDFKSGMSTIPSRPRQQQAQQSRISLRTTASALIYR